jgi:hypothetical protein
MTREPENSFRPDCTKVNLSLPEFWAENPLTHLP